MRDVLREWTPREKCFKCQSFLTDFRSSLYLKCFGEISQKSVKSTYLINSLKVDVYISQNQVQDLKKLKIDT